MHGTFSPPSLSIWQHHISTKNPSLHPNILLESRTLVHIIRLSAAFNEIQKLPSQIYRWINPKLTGADVMPCSTLSLQVRTMWAAALSWFLSKWMTSQCYPLSISYRAEPDYGSTFRRADLHYSVASELSWIMQVATICRLNWLK